MVARLNERPSADGQQPSGEEHSSSAALSRLEKEWKVRVHERLLKIMDLSLIVTIDEGIAREQIRVGIAHVAETASERFPQVACAVLLERG